MAWTHVQHTIGTTGTSVSSGTGGSVATPTVKYGSSTTAGSFLIAVATGFAQAGWSSPTISGGVTWTILTNYSNAANNIAVWCCNNAASVSSGTLIQANLTALAGSTYAYQSCQLDVWEFTSPTGYGKRDVTSLGNGTCGSSTPGCGSITPTNAGELLFCVYSGGNGATVTETAGAGFTFAGSQQSNMGGVGYNDSWGAMYNLNCSSGAQTPTFGTAINNCWAGYVNAFVAYTYPTITTQAASGTTATGTTGNGNITSLGGDSSCSAEGFVYGTSSQSLPGNVAPGSTSYTSYVTQSGTFSTGAFTEAVTSLANNTTYYMRAWAQNSAGYAYGAEVSFTTLIALPTVTTQAATAIAQTTATGNGNITATGGANSSAEGFVYGTSSQSLPGNVAPGSSGYTSYVTQSGSYGTGAFTEGVTGLTANTTYYMRAWSQNSTGYAYGAEVSFSNVGTTLSFSGIFW